jgi:two-component system CheB/CheR fusion protein
LHDDVISEAAKLLLPNLIVLNEQFDIIYKKGKPDFLTLNDGYVSYNFFKMVDPRLAIDIRKAIKQAKETNQIAMTSLVQLDETRHLKTFVVPLARRLDDLYVLYFSELAQSELPQLYAEVSTSERPEDTKLLFELERTKEHMNTLVEELETSNEELQSTIEELQSANEELQSTNEELETSNEELQSTNEELQTAYAELKHLYDLNEQFKKELSETNLRYEKVLDSLNDAVTVSTIDGTIVRTNQAMQSLTGLHTHALLAKTWRDLVNEVEFISEARKQELVSKGIFGPYNVSISNAEGQERVLKVKDYLIKHSEKQHLIWTFASDVTFELESKKALEASEQKYRTIFNSADIGIAEVALNGSFRRVNKALCQFLGYSEQALLGTSLQEITYLNDVESRDDEQHPLINASDAKQEIRYFRADGNIVWGRTSVKRIIDNAEQSQDYLVISVEDIQEIKANMHRLEQAQVVFNATREAIMITDPNFIIQSVNEAFERTTGYLPKEAIGQSASILKSGKHAESFYQEMVRVIKQTGMFSGEIINKNKQGEFYPAFLNITSVTDKAGKLIQYIGVLTDISMLKESQQKINFLANHDTLTGLPNRSLFTDRLEHALEKAKRHNSNLAILFVDLDRFKVINDGLGHHVGDQVLVSISERFQQVLRNEDTIARIGGDEFIVILDDLRSPIDASKVAKTLIEEAERVVDVYEHSVNVGCSIGISIYPNDGHSTNELLRLADIAMYDAKAAGRSTYRFTSEAMSSDAFEKVTIENAIRDGLTNNEFELFFQPIVDMHTMDIAHAEALIRWNHPTMGLVMPGRFVPIAEESNLIVSISEFVVFEALKAMEQFESLAQHPIKVSINFSAKDFASMELFLKVKGYLEQQKIDASSLILELTERMLMKSDSQQQQLLQRYESLGMELAIDDFGTGYSNLNLLSEMRVDYLKIDRSFVERIGQDRASEELVKATIAIAKALGLKTIAEGIETEEQLNFLRDNDCDLGQGYYLYVPQSLPDMASILKP